jgi:hypothetical protein
MDQHLTRGAVDLQIDKYVFVDFIMIEEVVRVDLIGPFGAPGIRVAREDRGGPEVIAAALIGIPGAWVSRAVVDQVQLGVIGDPAPYRTAADLPAIGRPACDAEVLSFRLS